MEKGFCADIPFLKATDQELALIAAGVKAGDIYVDGRGAQNWEMLVVAFTMRRDKIKQLSIWGTLRVIGDSRKLITSRIKELHDAGIVALDRETKLRSDRDGVAMLDAAQAKIQGSAKVKNDRVFAQKIAAKGGKGKLDAMRKRRMPEEIARPIWHCEKLTAAERIKLLNPPGFFEGKWTAATAYRLLRRDR